MFPPPAHFFCVVHGSGPPRLPAGEAGLRRQAAVHGVGRND
jgi:hypothetical protein